MASMMQNSNFSASTRPQLSRRTTFGDGGSLTNTGTTATHTYNGLGSFSVGLIVNGPASSATNTQAGYIVVTNLPPPVASFSGTPRSGLAPLLVNFTNTSTGSFTNNVWTFWVLRESWGLVLVTW